MQYNCVSRYLQQSSVGEEHERAGRRQEQDVWRYVRSDVEQSAKIGSPVSRTTNLPPATPIINSEIKSRRLSWFTLVGFFKTGDGWVAAAVRAVSCVFLTAMG